MSGIATYTLSPGERVAPLEWIRPPRRLSFNLEILWHEVAAGNFVTPRDIFMLREVTEDTRRIALFHQGKKWFYPD